MSGKTAPTLVPYEPPTGISRRGFRLLILLTLINTTLLGTYVLGPGISTFVKQQWADYQKRKAERAIETKKSVVRQAFIPTQQQCMTYSPPAGKLVYAEDPQGIAELTAAGPVNRVSRIDTGNWQKELGPAPVGLPDPPFTAAMPNTVGVPFAPTDQTLLFMHERSTAAGSRLVVVYVRCLQTMTEIVHSGGYFNGYASGSFWNALQRNTRRFDAFVLIPATPSSDLKLADTVQKGFIAGTTLITVPEGAEKGSTHVDFGPRLRLYAGQIDSSDPALFHIPYSLGDHHGTIDGRLMADDTLRLTPDTYFAEMEKKAETEIKAPSPDVERASGKQR